MPKRHESRIEDLHPTQLTVGMLEVNDKKHHLATLGLGERRKFMEDHPFPAVRGPRGRLYVTDHHHLGRSGTTSIEP
jgi:hypothetical protein